MQRPSRPQDSVADEALWPVERFMARHYTIIALTVIALLIVNELLGFGARLRDWDWLFVTGVVTAVIAVRTALDLPRAVHQSLTRLVARGALRTEVPSIEDFESRLHRETRRSTPAWALATATAMLVGWTVAKRENLSHYGTTVAVEVIGAAVAGLFVGRAVGYGQLGEWITGEGLDLRTEPEHFDSAAGLRPVGQLYFFQAAVLAVAATFLAVWWYIIPFFGPRYADWRDSYAGLLALVVALEILAFILPMLSFHRLMVDQKRTLEHEADVLSLEATGFRASLSTATTDDERAALQREIALREARYKSIEAMPTWPVDVRLRRRFTINNVFLLLPVFAQAVGLSEGWRTLIENLQKVIGTSA
jgi:hypothetical protein